MESGRTEWTAVMNRLEQLEKQNRRFKQIGDEPMLSFRDRNERVRASLAGTTLELLDEAGFQTTIGSTDLITTRTGESRRTSAASLVLLDKDKRVLWRAP